MSQIIRISVDLKLVPYILYSGLFLFIFVKKNSIYTASAFHLVCIFYKVKTSKMEYLKTEIDSFASSKVFDGMGVNTSLTFTQLFIC